MLWQLLILAEVTNLLMRALLPAKQSLEELGQLIMDLRDQLSRFENSDAELEQLQANDGLLREQYHRLATEISKQRRSAAKKLDKASTATKKTATAAKQAAKAAPAKAKAAAKKAPAKAKATASKAKAATKSAAKKTTDKAKNLAAKAKETAKPKADSETKGGRIGPSRDTPLSKMAWFKNAKK